MKENKQAFLDSLKEFLFYVQYVSNHVDGDCFRFVCRCSCIVCSQNRIVCCIFLFVCHNSCIVYRQISIVCSIFRFVCRLSFVSFVVVLVSFVGRLVSFIIFFVSCVVGVATSVATIRYFKFRKEVHTLNHIESNHKLIQTHVDGRPNFLHCHVCLHVGKSDQ